MPEITSSKYLVMAGWEDVPHLDAETRAELLAATPPHLREARSRGIPTMGSGKIFPIDEDAIKVDAFPIPPHWPRIVGMDFGWDHPTAASWLAWDRDTDTVYVFDTHRLSEATPDVHAAAIRRRGEWIPVAWPHDGLQHDKSAGIQLAQTYREEGLRMLPEMATFPEQHQINGQAIASRTSVEAGIMDMLLRMQQGRWKVFRHLADWFDEFRMYHREDGKIVKVRDDLLSSSRYAMMMLRFAATEPKKAADFRKQRKTRGRDPRVL